MIPYVAQIISKENWVLFEKIRRAVLTLPDRLDLGENEDGGEIILSSHILARAVAKVFDLDFVDGSFVQGFNHSWILTSTDIIDVDPVGILNGPIFVDGHRSSPARQLYIPFGAKLHERHYGKQFEEPSFKRAVGLVARALRQAIQRRAGSRRRKDRRFDWDQLRAMNREVKVLADLQVRSAGVHTQPD